MFVAASSRCFARLPLDAALLQLVELEYTSVEIMVHETDGHLKPSEVMANTERAVAQCRANAPPHAHRAERRIWSARAGVLSAVRRLLPPGKGHQSSNDHRSLRRIGHALQRRSGTAAAIGFAGGARRRPRRAADGGRPHDRNAGNGRGDVRQRQGARHHARSQPLRLWSPRRRQFRAGNAPRLPRPAPRHQPRISSRSASAKATSSTTA